MKTLIFDLETDGLLPSVSKIHSLVIRDYHTGLGYSCCDQPSAIPIEVGLEMLAEADEIIGHNIINYDLPVIRKLHPGWSTNAKITDTILMSRLYLPNLLDFDYANLRAKSYEIPPKLMGRHSLEAWGYRVGELKGEFGKTTDWSEWSLEMQFYCEQDVTVTTLLYQRLKEGYLDKWGSESLELEHRFAELIQCQEAFGFPFNEKSAVELYARLSQKRTEISDHLKQVFPPVDKGAMFTPKVNNKTRGYVKGVPIWRPKIVEFNPASRDHIAERLTERGWKPETYTEKGKPEVNEETLEKIGTPEAKLLIEYLMINKRIGQIAEGDQAWLKVLAADARIHGAVTTNGAVTGRCTHHHPNVAQVPAVGAPYGEECRALFGPPAGYYQLGCDASGIELRCLAHYLARYDGGKYMEVLLNGDIHTENQKAAGLPTRADAKRFIYAYLYGAGDVLIGSLFEPQAPEAKQRSLGKRIKAQFLDKTPALRQLITDVRATASTRKFLRGLDGRHLHVRSEHSALNLLFQSAGALIMKQATIIMWNDLFEHGFTFGREVAQMAHIHDEYQLAVRNDIPKELVGEIAVNAIRKAGEHFGFRCPLDGEYKTGSNWAETH